MKLSRWLDENCSKWVTWQRLSRLCGWESSSSHKVKSSVSYLQSHLKVFSLSLPFHLHFNLQWLTWAFTWRCFYSLIGNISINFVAIFQKFEHSITGKYPCQIELEGGEIIAITNLNRISCMSITAAAKLLPFVVFWWLSCHFQTAIPMGFYS